MRSEPTFRAVRSAAICVGLCAAAIPGACVTPVMMASAGLSAAQAGTTAFVRGDLEAAMLTPMHEVWAATEAALLEMGFAVAYDRHSGDNAVVVAEQINDSDVRIEMWRRTDRVTRLSIRVGFFGDEAISRLILSRIEARLPAPPDPLAID